MWKLARRVTEFIFLCLLWNNVHWTLIVGLTFVFVMIEKLYSIYENILLTHKQRVAIVKEKIEALQYK
ncbi:MAG: hypothetical protein P4N41_15760 [Negativicutes bacterium]|nr:hypothetical protein [Negativicutes bacterium]MDR3591110.1 hypothetical protein [Negativicutes bacterium]